MKYFLVLIILSSMLIKCTSKNNLTATPCDTCGQHVDTGGSKTDTSKKVILDTVPVTITILTGDQMVENISGLDPISLSVVVKNKAGQSIKGVSISFTATQNSGSVSPASQFTDSAGMASANWTLNPQPDTAEEVVAKVIYNNIDLFVRFHASVIQNPYYNFTGTLIMSSTIDLVPSFLPFFDSSNRPDPFTIPSDLMALSNDIAYPFELDSIRFPIFQPGEHGENGFSIMTINNYVYPEISVSYEVDGLIIMEVTSTITATVPESFTATMQWQFRWSKGVGQVGGMAYLIETVSSPTRGTFTNGRSGSFSMTGQVLH
jgi:Bacterial Ig-like domain (group 1)